MPGALHGVRVLDLSWGIAGPLGVLLLAEQGADVIKVEPPGGDPFRDYSGYAVWNRSRRSVTVDLKQPGRRRRVPQARRRRRRARRDVPARRHRPARHRLRRAARRATRASSTCRAPRTPKATGSRNGPATTRSCRRAAASSGSSRAGGMGPIFLHMPMPSMGAMFLVPTGHPHRADRARGRRAAASTCARRCSRARCSTRRRSGRGSRARGADFYGTMGKSYPPGVHQQMIFEVADDEWVHTSIMSGLAPVKSQDEIARPARRVGSRSAT